jgi:hypothetical protein
MTVAFLLMSGLYAQSKAPAEALKAANDGFVKYLTTSVTEDTKTIVGFDAGDDLSKAVLGEPFQLYTLPADSIRNYRGTTKVRSLIQKSEFWYFPILIGGKVKMMLYVGKRKDVWERAGLGSAGLAREMQVLLTQYSPKKGYTPLLVQQRNTGNYLFSVPQVDDDNLTEAFSGVGTGNPHRYATLKKLKTTMLELKQQKEIQGIPVH